MTTSHTCGGTRDAPRVPQVAKSVAVDLGRLPIRPVVLHRHGDSGALPSIRALRGALSLIRDVQT